MACGKKSYQKKGSSKVGTPQHKVDKVNSTKSSGGRRK